MHNSSPLRLESPEDVLSSIPHALGFWPAESLVCLTLQATTVRVTLRLDLPAPGPSNSYRGFVHQICDYLSTDDEANGTLVVLYTSVPWLRPAAPPYRSLVKELATVLADAGLPIRDGWLVAERHWRDYFCPEASCCEWPGQSLEVITSSRGNAEQVFRGSSYAQTVEEAMGLRPGLRRAENRQALQHTDRYRGQLADAWLAPGQFRAVLALWEQALQGQCDIPRKIGQLPPGIAGPETAGFLLASLECKTVRDSVLVLASAGMTLAFGGALQCGALGEEQQLAILPSDATGLTVPSDPSAASAECPISAADELEDQTRDQGAEAGLGTEYGQLLIGESTQPPRWRTMDRAFDLFLQLLEISDPLATPALLTMLAWLEWCRGRGSRAEHFLRLCLDTTPDYRLAHLLEALLAQGTINGWARNRQNAWRPSYPDSA